MKCVYCNSIDVVLSGKRYNESSTKHIYKCNGCKRHFVESEDKGNKFNPKIKSEASELRKKGYSLSQVQNKLVKDYNLNVSRTAIMNWEKKISEKIKSSKKGMKKIKIFFEGKKIVITGGCGSIGRALVQQLISFNPNVIRIYDNDEEGVFLLEKEIEEKFPNFVNRGGKSGIRFLIGDVKDRERMTMAFRGADIIFHLAALKHVKSGEYNPFEVVKTNVIGTQNVIDAALENNVEKVIFSSSDKAVNSNNIMGTTKLLGEKLIRSANYYKGDRRTKFAAVRFGNVMNSSGSVIPIFKRQIENGGPVTITDPEMSRFIMSLSQAVNLLLKCTAFAEGGETFILKMPVIKIKDLAGVMIEEISLKNKINSKNINVKIVGPREGERLYEELMTEEEAAISFESDEFYIVPPPLGTLPDIVIINTKDIQTSQDLRKKYNEAKSITKKYTSKDEMPLSKQEIKLVLHKEELI